MINLQNSVCHQFHLGFRFYVKLNLEHLSKISYNYTIYTNFIYLHYNNCVDIFYNSYTQNIRHNYQIDMSIVYLKWFMHGNHTVLKRLSKQKVCIFHPFVSHVTVVNWKTRSLNSRKAPRKCHLLHFSYKLPQR